MIKTKSIALTSCLLALYCFSSALLSNEIIIYGNENKAPKYYFEDKKAKGILIDIMRYVDSKLPETFNYELYPWKRALYYASQAKGGIIGFSKNKERLKTFDYSDVMYSEVINLVVLQGHEFHYQNISSLQGKRIGVQRGSSYGDTFEKSKSTLTYHEDGSGEQRLLKLLNKRIDVA
ncbi:substrate-binding periplasmic protein, partial [Paraglaciecola sp.]|uniref:substrate-binding periplasmic protein n=1 Tax=Paraglaciecola sp. TaxID=1920173 RepID=UPI003EF2D038